MLLYSVHRALTAKYFIFNAIRYYRGRGANNPDKIGKDSAIWRSQNQVIDCATTLVLLSRNSVCDRQLFHTVCITAFESQKGVLRRRFLPRVKQGGGAATIKFEVGYWTKRAPRWTQKNTNSHGAAGRLPISIPFWSSPIRTKTMLKIHRRTSWETCLSGSEYDSRLYRSRHR